MQDQPKAGRRKRSWKRRAVRFLIGFAVTLVVGKTIETVTDDKIINAAYSAQESWITAVSHLSPLGVASTFLDQTSRAWRGEPLNPDDYDINRAKGAGILSPLAGLFGTIGSLFRSGQFFVLIQIAFGGIGIAAFNMARSKGKTIFFKVEGPMIFIVHPVAIIAAASVLAFGLQIFMLAALFSLHWLTGLAGAAAGATGAVGFCWYCLTKLGEKGAEHALTPEL